MKAWQLELARSTENIELVQQNYNYQMLGRLLNDEKLLEWLTDLTDTPDSADILILVLKMLKVAPPKKKITWIMRMLTNRDSRCTLTCAYLAWKTSTRVDFLYAIGSKTN